MTIAKRNLMAGSAGYTAADYPALENCPILLDGIENYAFGVHHDDVEQWRSLTRPWCFLQRRNTTPTEWSENSPIIPIGSYATQYTGFSDMVGRYGQTSQSMQGLRDYSVSVCAKVDTTRNGTIFGCGLMNSHPIFWLRKTGVFYHRSLYASGYGGDTINGAVDEDGNVHFTFTHDSTAGVVKVYVKGMFVTEFTITSLYTWQINSLFALAIMNDLPSGDGSNYNTCVKSVHSAKLYNKVLSAEEIATIYAIDKARFGIS